MKTLINLLCVALLFVLANCGAEIPAAQEGAYDFRMQSGQLVPAGQALLAPDQSEPGISFSSDDGKLQTDGQPAPEDAKMIESDGTANSCSGTVNCRRRSCSCRGDRSCCVSTCIYLICRYCGC